MRKHMLESQDHDNIAPPFWVNHAAGPEYALRVAVVKAMRKCEGAFGPHFEDKSSKSAAKYVKPLSEKGLVVSSFLKYILHTRFSTFVSVLHPWDWGNTHSMFLTPRVKVSSRIRGTLTG
jgi:hypothetical protein